MLREVVAAVSNISYVALTYKLAELMSNQLGLVEV